MNKKQTLINDIKENCLVVDKTTEGEALNTIYKWAFEILSVAQLEKLKRHSELLIDKAIADRKDN